MPIQTVPVAEPKLPVIQVADGKTAQVIGKVSAIQGEAWIVRGGQKIAAAAEAPLVKGDSVETADGAQISLVFADRSTFVLKDKGLIGLDDFTYDPATKTGSESILVAQGAFSFVSGDIAKSAPGAAKVATPAMSIGIRGTTVVGSVAAGGETSVALQPDPGSSFVGEITLSRPGSSDPPLTISTPGAGVLGATSGSSFTVSNNAGSVVSASAPAPSAPPASPPSLPSAPSTGPATGPA
ncbi:MAG: FecR family protein, partial [Magnetospirillum sp.]|nr:FecR family protein [Magnetospirillum sp.]